VAIGRVEKSDWQSVIRKRLFEPLQMTNACCTVREAEAKADHAVPHFRPLAGGIQSVTRGQIDSARGAGSILASARDMANWLRFQLADGSFSGKRLLPAEVLRETRTAQMVVRQEGRWKVFFPPDTTQHLAYGLGWFVHDYRGKLVVSHGGTVSGFRAQTALVPEFRCGVVVFGNLTPSMFPEALKNSLLDHLLGLPSKDWIEYYRKEEAKQENEIKEQGKKRTKARKPNTRPSLELAAYSGGYEEPAYGKALVQKDGEGLVVRWGDKTFRLEHYHFDTFTAVVTAPAESVLLYDRVNLDAQFRLGADGKVEGLRFLDQDFKRIKPPAK
jgi:CubicO group peptidase (beta-lactamase class C family)